MAEHEVWKSIPGHKGYEVSDRGRVRSVDRWLTYKSGQRVFYRGKILRQFRLSGYKTTHLGAKNINKYIHHLVALAFIGKTPKGMEICHNNGVKIDNRLENLRFDTRWHNVFDTLRHRYEQAWLNQNVKNTK